MMTGHAAQRRLRMLYRDIPPAKPCVAGCNDCCGPVVWAPAELEQVQAQIPLTARWIELFGERALEEPATGKCPFASTEGCRVYDRRPFVCRLFASAADTRLQCPHGRNAKRPLSRLATAKLTDKYREEWPHTEKL